MNCREEGKKRTREEDGAEEVGKEGRKEGRTGN